MRKFKDSDGREWSLRLSVGMVESVRRQTEVNIAWDNWSWADTLIDNPGKFVSILWVMVEKQAQAVSVDPESFGMAFDGPTLEAAGRALGEAIADFFPFEDGRQKLRERLLLVFDPRMASPLPTSAPESAELTPEN